MKYDLEANSKIEIMFKLNELKNLNKMTDEDLFYYCCEWSDNKIVIDLMYKKLLRMRRR